MPLHEVFLISFFGSKEIISHIFLLVFLIVQPLPAILRRFSSSASNWFWMSVICASRMARLSRLYLGSPPALFCRFTTGELKKVGGWRVFWMSSLLSQREMVGDSPCCTWARPPPSSAASPPASWKKVGRMTRFLNVVFACSTTLVVMIIYKWEIFPLM